ncbi:FAD-binding oxidoreductase [Flammeovirga sp. OC4]|uniref:FAD-binding oxidoreductase n=1 Tax=Flammeovirga sp. OC4 TaxID=1382345 RepID=UPI0005C714E8|nr:FAD-binding oxidoreductase [Flammeovirga sp. OC4]
MYQITLKNNKSFSCEENESIFDAARKKNIHLEHSCLKARCSACKVRVLEGETERIEEDLILTDEEKDNNYILSCNTIPKSDLKLDIEDLGYITIYESKIYPSKINKIEKLTSDVVALELRLPPTANFQFNAGQYVNLIKGTTKRSYSIAKVNADKTLVFYIKNYEGGLMSQYWFNEAKLNDLIRLEGPLGTFFYRPKEEIQNIILLATGTGIAPINAILNYFDESPDVVENKSIHVYFGARYNEDLFWSSNFKNISLTFTPVLSRPNNTWKGKKGYIQRILLEDQIDLQSSQVFACGSNQMINDAKRLLIENKLKEENFYADAFICTN